MNDCLRVGKYYTGAGETFEGDGVNGKIREVY
jgi:hypothetical protein